MAVPRAKKNKAKDKIRKGNKQDLMIGIQELTKCLMYLYLRDKKRFTLEDIQEMNNSFARQVMQIREGLITFDDVLDMLLAKGVDMNEVGKNTDNYLNKYWEV